MKKIRFLDIILLGLFLFAGIYLTIRSSSIRGGVVKVSAGEKKYEYSIDNDGVYRVDGILGQTVFEIKDGKIHIVESPCKNKTCINQGYHLPLVCLPNDVIISVEDSGAKGEYDAISE